MRYCKSVRILSILIGLFSLLAGVVGIASSGGPGPHLFTSLHGASVQLFGHGIYSNDSVSSAAQTIAQDWVTVCLGVPLLLISLFLAGKGYLRARLLLGGTLAYFLYTYASYSFLCMYNRLFLVYVALMSLSFFAFVLVMMSFEVDALAQAFSKKFPAKTVAVSILTFTMLIALMWLGRIVPSLVGNTVPAGLEHYTTLVIQALDLGFVIPVSILASVLLLQRKPFGLLLSAIMCMKCLTMLTSLTAMVVSQILSGIHLSAAEIAVFPLANIFAVIGVILFMRSIKEPAA